MTTHTVVNTMRRSGTRRTTNGEATGETAVVVTRVRARARATGRDLRLPVLQTGTVRNGQITEVRPFCWDTQAIADPCAGSASRDRLHIR
ncbi:nuclear transport factor 2 family protein [Streptomyces sp. B1I3]|uniref:nuclear transport factor 2 family protein n=1 Tax=Streptomyces sp. B1I3 TaxID=3042264 RepID=UPI002789F3D2|nr:ketosteroid isomerase-like protein [Streptomyces sp. B1I3]